MKKGERDEKKSGVNDRRAEDPTDGPFDSVLVIDSIVETPSAQMGSQSIFTHAALAYCCRFMHARRQSVTNSWVRASGEVASVWEYRPR